MDKQNIDQKTQSSSILTYIQKQGQSLTSKFSKKEQQSKLDTKILYLPNSHIRQMSFADYGTLGVLLTVDAILIVDIIIAQVVKTVRKIAYPRSAKISKDGKYIVAHYSDNIVYIINAITGKDIQTVVGIPQGSRTFYFSDNSRKLIFGNNQTVCIWSIKDCQIQIMSQNWKNINCFAINFSGNQFALGTYNGTIYILTIMKPSSCKQIQINKHQNCIMCISYQNDKIISISHDKRLIITTMKIIKNLQAGINQIAIAYQQKILSSLPKQIISSRQKFFLIGTQGIMWFDSLGLKLMGFDDKKLYTVMHNQNDQIIIFKLDNGGVISWWPAIKFIRQKNRIYKSQIGQVKRVFRFIKKQSQN